MPSQYTPVTFYCPKCGVQHVDFEPSDMLGNPTVKIPKKMLCDKCYGPHLSPELKASMMKLIAARRRKIYSQNRIANLSYLSTLHAELYRAGLLFGMESKQPDSDLPHNEESLHTDS